MLPLLYKLRKNIRFEARADSGIVISETPLNVIRVNKRIAHLLGLCDGKRTLKQIAGITHFKKEDIVLNFCEYFKRRGILEIQPVQGKKYLPYVSVIIPVKDRRKEIIECLRSISLQEYPKDRIETIVIDDGSNDGIGDLRADFSCSIITSKVSRGQSYCRNLGAKRAKGEILAFLDSDCVAGRKWLKELTAYFQWERIGAVGGHVDGYYQKSSLDRYEKKMSSLNMGKNIIFETGSTSTFYAPTCNLLIRKSIYLKSGGIREDMQVGEDVDLCWRIRNKGYNLLYVPFGSIKHKHRNNLLRMLRRRADYGTSEAVLYCIHPEKRKSLLIQPVAALGFLAFCTAAVFTSALPLTMLAACVIFEIARKTVKMHKMHLYIPPQKIMFSVIRTYFSFFYFVSFHIVRYYMLLLLLLGFAFHPVWLMCLFMIVISSITDYFIKKPKLNFLIFISYYIPEHISYQLGVFIGCLKQRSFRCYRAGFTSGRNNDNFRNSSA